MIFYPKSPRNISIKDASYLQKKSENLNINGVGVFVNKNIEEIKYIINKVKLNFVKLHGLEDEEYIKILKNIGVKVIKSIPISNKNDLKKIGVKVIKSISLGNKNDLKNINNYNSADYYLFDYKPVKGELPGGNAKSFDWDIINNLKTNKPWFLSGGINIKNIQKILNDINPFGIDLSSGVEKELGIKDNHIINNFIDKLKNA